MATNASERQRLSKKENFLRQFRDEQSKELKKLTAAQFMEIWSHYDTDGKIIFTDKIIYLFNLIR
jgi:hypothetical protein